MKKLGILGGIGPETTLQYYRSIVAQYRLRVPDGSYPALVINSIDMTRMLRLVANDVPALVAFLSAEIVTLAQARVDFAVLASNTPHMVFDQLERASPIPLISIVETTYQQAAALNLKKPGLLGTKFTMGGSFYPDFFARHGLAVVVPSAAQQDYIHQVYFAELVHGLVRDETRQSLLQILAEMRLQHQIDGVILGGTELSLILTEPAYQGLPVLDTTQLHVRRIVDEITG